MQTIPSSIYIKPVDLKKRTAKERLSIMASELRTCENLLTMGFEYSNGQSIRERMAYLDGEITYLEQLIGKKKH